MVWKFFSVMLFATVKTLFAPAVGFAAGMPYLLIFAATAIGGALGFMVFYFFSSQIMNYLNKRRKQDNRAKQLKKARKIVMMKKKYPMWLFVFILPFMSIPVMAVIVKKFYGRDKKVILLSYAATTLFALLGCVICSPVSMI
ncbi:MAG: hypothetical protein MJZ47_04235 [Bacteroidales bacterium]|nr:hypothetical protein [Bacteroidales bacterium]